MLDQFERTQLMLGPDALKALSRSRVAVFGLGGVGGYVVEALARAGVGALDIVDSDKIGLTNLNRQVFATHDTIGQWKADVAAARIRSINPACAVTAHRCFYLPETAGDFDFSQYDYVVDAIDTVTGKLQLARAAQDAGTPFISCMGAANKMDPTRFKVADINDTQICPLARIIRKECRKRGIRGFKAVYSEEPALGPYEGELERLKENALTDAAADLPHESRRSIPGSISFVPAAAGFICAGEVVKDLIGWDGGERG